MKNADTKLAWFLGEVSYKNPKLKSNSYDNTLF